MFMIKPVAIFQILKKHWKINLTIIILIAIQSSKAPAITIIKCYEVLRVL